MSVDTNSKIEAKINALLKMREDELKRLQSFPVAERCYYTYNKISNRIYYWRNPEYRVKKSLASQDKHNHLKQQKNIILVS
jgi:hypothetical protein